MAIIQVVDISEEASEYEVIWDGGEIESYVTASKPKAGRWIRTKHLKEDAIVGMDVKYEQGNPVLLSLCVGKDCLLFQISRADDVPYILRHWLYTKRMVGLKIGSADRALRESFRLKVSKKTELSFLIGSNPDNVEFRDLEVLVGMKMDEEPPLENALGNEEMHADDQEGRRWDSNQLSNDQVKLATLHCFLCWEVGKQLLD